MCADKHNFSLCSTSFYGNLCDVSSVTLSFGGYTGYRNFFFSQPGAPAPSLDDLERDARELRAQLAAERDLGRKRDAIIARYEHWYSALKASAAARRRPSHEGSFEA